MALVFSTTLRHTRLDAITTAIGTSGKVRIYSGTQPASGGTATTQLAELPLSATAAPAATGGKLTLNAITADSSADATGTATWFRVLTSANAFVIDGTVTATGGGGDLQLNTTSIVINGSVSISSFEITEPNA